MTESSPRTERYPERRPASDARARLWVVCAIAYATTFFGRTSLTALGPAAAARFQSDAATLSLLGGTQLLVYGLVQIPVGRAIARWGARYVVVLGLVLGGIGQLVMASATTPWIAILARILIGIGDAAVFPSIVDSLSRHLSERRMPLATQIMALLGQSGIVVSAFALPAAVASYGWDVAFVGAGSIALLVAIATASFLPAGTGGAAPSPRPRLGPVGPGVRLAFWAHAATSAATNSFSVLWGYPFLTTVAHLSPALAGALLTIHGILGAALGPLVGHQIGAVPNRRFPFLLGISAAQILSIALAAGTSGAIGGVIALILSSALGAPTSLLAYDLARAAVGSQHPSIAIGVANSGGFLVGVVVVVTIGVVTDLTAGSVAAGFTSAIPILGMCMIMMLIERRRAEFAHV